MPRISQGVAAGVAQHVAVNLEQEARALTDALYTSIDGVRRERAAALNGKHEGGCSSYKKVGSASLPTRLFFAGC
jgi:hypothetical protein